MKNQELKLKNRTLELFRSLPRNVKNVDISEATGLKPSWITDFTKGRVKSPNVDYVETLYIFLSKKSLDI